jgi:hypothetical protein
MGVKVTMLAVALGALVGASLLGPGGPRMGWAQTPAAGRGTPAAAEAERWIGLDLEPVTESMARSLGLERAAGLLVRAVTPRSPAAWAGIQSGDVLESVAGAAVADIAQVAAILRTLPIGSTVGLGLRRGVEPVTVVFQVERRPGS